MSLSGFKSDNPIVQKILDGSAADPIRLAAARGALPLDPADLFRVLYLLSADGDEAVRDAVEQTVAEFPDEHLAGLLDDPQLPPTLLDFFAERLAGRQQATDAVITHAHTGAATLEVLARGCDARTLDVLVTNQVRLIESPAIMDAMLENPALTGDIKRRIQELREEFFEKKERERARREAEARLSEEELAKLAEQEARKARQEFEAGTLTAEAEALAMVEDEDPETRRRISELNVPEKIRLALRGNRSDRMELVRDSNRLVCSTVMKSPKLTESEVELIANMRNVQEDVLRMIGNSREWLRNYNVMVILVNNPRTPLPIAMNLMTRLHQQDIKRLENNRNVPEQLRRQAKQIMQRSQQRAGAKH